MTYKRKQWCSDQLCEVLLFALAFGAIPMAADYNVLFDTLFPPLFALILLAFSARILLKLFPDKLISLKFLPNVLLWLMIFPVGVLWYSILFGHIRLINPLFPAVVLAGGGFAIFMQIKKLWTVSVLLLMVLLVEIPLLRMYFDSDFSVPIFINLVGLLMVGMILFSKRKLVFVYELPSWIPASLTMSLISIWMLTGFYWGVNDLGLRQNVEATHLDATQLAYSDQLPNGVRQIFGYEKGNKVGNIVGKQLMFVMEGCMPNELFIGSQTGQFALVRLNIKTGQIVPAKVPIESTDNALLDCEHDQIIVGEFSKKSTAVGGIHFLSLSNWPAPSRKPIRFNKQSVIIEWSKGRDVFYVSTESTDFMVIDAQSGEIVSMIEGPDEWVYFPAKDQFLVFTEPDFSLQYIKYDRTERQIKTIKTTYVDVPIHKRLTLFPAWDSSSNQFFISSMWEGTIRIYDKTLKHTNTFFVDHGVRNMAKLPDRPIMAVANYASGVLSFLDTRNNKVLKDVFLGYRMRAFNFSKDGSKLYIGTSNGGFVIDLDIFLPEDISKPQSLQKVPVSSMDEQLGI